MEEMRFLEEKREKIAFDGALPPTSDEASFILRRKLMEDQEIKDWRNRENEIKRVQNERLNLLQSALIEDEKEMEEKGEKRVEAIKIKKTENKHRLVAKIQKKKIKFLRKILKIKRSQENDNRKRDIVEEYHNFASRVYANITREGLSLDKLSGKFEVQPYSLQSYEGFNELVDCIKEKHLESHFDLDEFNKKMQKKYAKLQKEHQKQLKEAQNDINGERKKKVADEAEDRDDDNNFQKIVIRPETAVHQFINDIDNLVADTSKAENVNAKKEAFAKHSSQEQAVLLLQRLIRGRAVQNLMFEGKEKRLALIDELLLVNDIPLLAKEEDEKLLVNQHEQQVKNAFLEALQGELIVETLDVTSKELLRFKEQKKISKFVKEAEDDRRVREAEETGRRQAEITLREREDVLYKEIMKVQQGTVDSYLTVTMHKAIDHLASKQALKMALMRKKNVEERNFSSGSKQETVIKDLVSRF
jgi:hypothetical protein